VSEDWHHANARARERNGVTVLDDAAFAGYRFTAEILDNGKPGGEIEAWISGAERPCSCNPWPIAMKGLISSASLAMAL